MNGGRDPQLPEMEIDHGRSRSALPYLALLALQSAAALMLLVEIYRAFALIAVASAALS